MLRSKFSPYILLAIFLAFLILNIRSCFVKTESQSSNLTQEEFVTVVFPDGWRVKAEVVRTPEAQARGLSGRQDLEADEGMLFALEEPREMGIWMRGMRFPIDVVWMRGGVVISLVKDAPVPEPGGEIPRFSPSGEADQILELPAGTLETHGVEIGGEIRIDPLIL